MFPSIRFLTLVPICQCVYHDPTPKLLSVELAVNQAGFMYQRGSSILFLNTDCAVGLCYAVDLPLSWLLVKCRCLGNIVELSLIIRHIHELDKMCLFIKHSHEKRHKLC